MSNVIVRFVAIFLICATICESSVKIWTPSVDIMNPRNWWGGKPLKNCKGIIFSERNTAKIKINTLQTEQIVFPTDGEIELENYIEFKHNDLMNCVKLKELNYHYWHDFTNWLTEGDEQNVAIPHTERVPCKQDVVKFTDLATAGMQFQFAPTVYEVYDGHSIHKGQNLIQFDETDHSYFQNVHGSLCKDKSGCLCGNEESVVCMYVEENENLGCENAVSPIGFCNHMCGAFILLTPKEDFDIDKIKKELYTNYEDVDTHISKVKNESGTFVQIIFAEKRFTAKSLQYATNYFDALKDKSYNVKLIGLYLSGEQFVEGFKASTIVLGSLIAAVAFFGIVFAYYNTSLSEYDVLGRLNLSSNGTLREFQGLFSNARYRRQSNMHFETQSLTGSVLSLEKSFDNPMFGKETPSTSKVINERDESSSEIVHENPLYDIKQQKEDMDRIDEM